MAVSPSGGGLGGVSVCKFSAFIDFAQVFRPFLCFLLIFRAFYVVLLSVLCIFTAFFPPESVAVVVAAKKVAKKVAAAVAVSSLLSP